MLFNTCCGIFVYTSLAMPPSIFQLKVTEWAKSIFMSYDIVYISYMFAKIHDKRFYQVASGLARTAMLVGKLCASIIAQTLVHVSGESYKQLPCYSLGSMVFAFVWAFFLPPAKRSRSRKETELKAQLLIAALNNNVPSKMPSINPEVRTEDSAPKRAWRDFNESYTNLTVLKWSVWYCVALTGYNVIKVSYVTREFGGNNQQTNRLVETLTTLIGAICSYKIGVRRVNWELKSNAFIGSGSLILGVCVVFCYFHQQLLSVYLSYALFGVLMQAMIVISLSEMAKPLKNKCYTLVLGFNSFVSVVLVLLFNVAFVRSAEVMKFTASKQLLFYGGMYIVLGTLYLIPCVVSFNRRLKKNNCPIYDVTE
ncbi:thiamine transporter 1-like isoform X2 [Adelges cooleyi]|nr:thiamine transporter 1-like isoform X2 [Adelges cooleyi]